MASRQAIISLFTFFTRIRAANPPSGEDIPDLVSDWELLCTGISDDELSVAGTAYARTGKFWPTPAEVIVLCPSTKKAALSLAADNSLTGRDLWSSVLRQAGSIGRNCREWPQALSERLRLPEDRLRDAVDAAGGWLAICNSSHDAERAGMGRRFAAAWSRQAEAKQVVGLIDFAVEARKRLGAKNGH